MKPPVPSPERQRRLRMAPVGLLLLGWGLGAGPVAHAVLAHGEPRVQDSADQNWVGHAGGEGGQPFRPREASHHHSPGGLEHLQLALFAAAACLAVVVVLRRLQTAVLPAWATPLLPRWRRPEVPGAP